MAKETLIESFSRLQSKLHLVASRMLRDEMEAQDAVQDTFCNLWAAGLSDAEVRFQLFAVLKNVCLNKLRRRRTFSPLDTLDIVVDQPDESDAERLKLELMRHLTPLQTQIFTLSAYDDLEYEEIAAKLDMSVDAVRTNMYRARKILRDQYKKLTL